MKTSILLVRVALIAAAGAVLSLMKVGVALAQTNEEPAMEVLIGLDLLDLADVAVTTVSRREEKLSNTSAAVYVITNEDIRRSGATSIPEALRMAPGVHVQQIDANEWAITIRGFSGVFADKLLVLIDGRTVYTPLFSGVYWDVQDVLLADVDRIEVVRGPGGTLWGANAVNGVINIITRDAAETQGGLAEVGVGTEDLANAAFRYGGPLGTDGHYRWYLKYFNRDDFVDSTGNDVSDEWSMGRAGIRLDWRPTTEEQITIQGDMYSGAEDESVAFTDPNVVGSPFVNDETNLNGANIVARWTREEADNAGMSLQLYYDYTKRLSKLFTESRHTVDIDYQRQLAMIGDHEITWGLGYRFTKKDVDGSFTLSFTPPNTEKHLGSAFLQDRIQLVDEKLQLIVGSKFEANEYSGLEVQPGIRFLWTPDDRNTTWASVARAVVTPSESVTDIRINVATVPVFVPPGGVQLRQVQVIGGGDLEAQDLLAYELGHRIAWSDNFTVDAAVFYNDYRNLTDSIVSADGFTSTITNNLEATSYGGEITGNWRVSKNWLCSVGYGGMRLDFARRPAINSNGASAEKPIHQVNIRSQMNLTKTIEFDVAFYYVENFSGGDIPNYTRMDARLGWNPRENLNMSLSAHNLLDDQHAEFVDILGFRQSSEIERSVQLRVTYSF